MLVKKDIEMIEKIVEKSENRIISVLSREVTDLAEINHAVIDKLGAVYDLEKRIIRLEHKAGIVG